MVTRCQTSLFLSTSSQASSRYPSEGRKLGTEREFSWQARQMTSPSAENSWERGWGFFLWTFLLEPANLKIRGSRGGIFNDFFEAISLLLMLDFKSPRLNSTETLLRICFIKAGLLQCFTYWTSKIPNRQSSVSTKYCGSHYNFYLLIWSYNSRSS